MFKSASNISITGGTFTVNNNSIHHHRTRGSSDLLQSATATAAFHNSDERFDPPKCHPNTRLAVLSKIMEWVKWEGDLKSFILWLYGPAGAGKSAIAQTIAEMCEEEMILLATFFFSRNDPSRSNVKPLIATIAYQITLNLPDVRDAIFAAVERDPLIFSKSLTVQSKSLIVEPLHQLVEVGYFHKPTSRRLVIIDGLDECSDPKVQQNIVEVLANAQQQHRLPLIFLFASRPEPHISLAFSTGALPGVTTRIALDESFRPDRDIELFLTDKFQEIKSTHRLHAYIPPQWPLPDVLKQLVEKSSGQFIYASTVINYVSSIRHKPQDRLDIVLGIRTPHRDLPFAELDALYTHILESVEDIDSVLEILSFLIFSSRSSPARWGSPQIEVFLFLQPGDVELHLGDLASLVNVGPDQEIYVLHASLTDFLIDPTRSKGMWINPGARHASLACRCLRLLQRKGHVELVWFGYCNTIYHCKSAEMTPELRNNLIKFSLDDFQGVLNAGIYYDMPYSVLTFIPAFLFGLKNLMFAQADHEYMSQTLQVDFDRLVTDILEKSHYFSGVALFLGSLLRQGKAGHPHILSPAMTATLYRQDVFYSTEFSAILNIYSTARSTDSTHSHLEFLNYVAELLENPERSKSHFYCRRRYAIASKECLQLCLCSHHHFSRAVETSNRDNVLHRNKPFLWRRRHLVHSRRGRHYLKVRERKLIKAQLIVDEEMGYNFSEFPDNSIELEYCRSLTYRWALDLLPCFLEKSAISSELVKVLQRCTFTTMAQKFPRRLRLAKEAITKYILRVEGGEGEA